MLSCFVLTTAAANGRTLAVTCSMLIIKMERSDHCETSRSHDNRKEFSNG